MKIEEIKRRNPLTISKGKYEDKIDSSVEYRIHKKISKFVNFWNLDSLLN